ncbi:putative zinc binding phosphatase [Trypanosoma vivax]|nr:putative zinc binding phosphatase [Trypanosoma vivax]
MSRGTLRTLLSGETIFFDIQQHNADGEAAALLRPTRSEGIPWRCALTISNYSVTIRPFHTGEEERKNFEFSLPLMSIESWSVPRVAMTSAIRAIFQQGRGQLIQEPDCASHAVVSSNSQQSRSQQMPSSADGNSQPSAYRLKIRTKHLWDVELLLHGERVENTGVQLRALCVASHLKYMPAFELYRKRYSCLPEVAEDASGCAPATDTKISVGQDDDIPQDGRESDSANAVEFGWNLFDPGREMVRQLCLDPESEPSDTEDTSRVGPMRDLRPWFRLTSVQQPDNAYGKTPTYPFQVVVPSAASDELLLEVMAARSRARFPVVSFVHLRSGAVLARSSQPLLRSNTLRQDGELCNMLTNSGYLAHNVAPKQDTRTAAASPTAMQTLSIPPPSLFDTDTDDKPLPRAQGAWQPQHEAPRRQRTLVVADCRPKTAAYANANLGGGYECGATHSFCEVKFHSIENIHAVSKSFAKLKDLISNFNGSNIKDDFLIQLYDTKWLYHVQRILICSNEIAEALDRGESCLVHCTDGWDRTPQCTATAMLLLDPFYRTIVGFCILVEKEFCSFGHKFAERCAHQVPGDTMFTVDCGVLSSDTEASTHAQQANGHQLQPSPIFVQWMDVVFQLVRQFPRHFEFTPLLLEYLSSEVYACLHGTFLCNCEKERMFEGVRLRTASIWTDVVRVALKERSGEMPFCFVNSTYDSAAAWEYISKKKGCGIQRISPNCSSKRIVFWESFYLRHDGDTLAAEMLDALRLERKQREDMELGCAERRGVQFHEEWECYFDQLIYKSAEERKREVVEMRELLQRLHVSRAPVGGQTAHMSSSKCHRCHKSFGVLGVFSRERCGDCRSVTCGDCMVNTERGAKLCRNCYNRREWNKP